MASFIPPSIAAVRSAYACSNFGTTTLAKAMASRIRKTKPKMTSAVCGSNGLGVSPASVSGSTIVNMSESCQSEEIAQVRKTNARAIPMIARTSVTPKPIQAMDCSLLWASG